MRIGTIVLSLVCLILSFISPTLLEGAISSQERAALIALYNSTTGAGWTNNTNWKGINPDADGFSQIGTENTWYGVTCDGGNTTVQRLAYYNNNLVGTIPTELGNLSSLQELWLYSNQLTGSIPTKLEIL